MPLPLRKLGKNGPSVPAVSFGLMGLSGGYGPPPPDEERFKVLDRAHELGATSWDTADMYGDNEEFINKWFQRTRKRNDIFIASKFGILMGPGLQFRGINSSAEYCKSACETSLKRLGVDCIDLFYCHRANPDTPIEETMRAMVELKEQGKIKYIGLPEISSSALRRAYKIAPVDAVQVEYSPFHREIEQESSTKFLDTCKELGIAVVCFSPLGRGLLTGRFTSTQAVSGEGDIRAGHFPWFSEENMETNIKIVEKFKGFATAKGCTPSQLALAWLLRQDDSIFPNPGTKSIKYLEENLQALQISISDEENAKIRKFVEENELAGYRSVAAAKAFEFVDTKAE